MRILAFESSAKAASAALLTDGVLTAESYQNDGQTHSRTMMKLAADLLDTCGLSPAQLDLVAWANGPGSFTGVRPGAARSTTPCSGARAAELSGCAPIGPSPWRSWPRICGASTSSSGSWGTAQY